MTGDLTEQPPDAAAADTDVSRSATAPPPDPHAVRDLHRLYAGALFAFAYRSLGDRERAEEVVQDTLVRAWQHADDFDPRRSSLRSWLFTTARNLVIDQRRRAGARPQSVATLDTIDLRDDAADLDRALESWQVADALSRLSAEHRAVIVETYYRGGSVNETAARLSIPSGTVKSRLYYGLRALRLHLEEMGAVQ